MAALVAAVAAGAAIYWFGPQHLLIDRTVDEALPVAEEPTAAVPDDTGAAEAEPGDGRPSSGDAITTLASGEFSSLAHTTTGSARVVEVADGTRYLRIEDLVTDSGPDLRIYLSEAPADGDEGALDDAFVDLGGLKGNQGNQNYVIPGAVDLDDIRSVSIWCRRFSVGFGVAPLDR